MFTSNNLYLKAALDMSFRPSNFYPGIILRPEWVVAPPIFTVNITVGSSKKALGFCGFLQWKNNVFDWVWCITSTKQDLPVPPLLKRIFFYCNVLHIHERQNI